MKSFKFNYMIDDRSSQNEVFTRCHITDLLDSAMDGYSATIFAYG